MFTRLLPLLLVAAPLHADRILLESYDKCVRDEDNHAIFDSDVCRSFRNGLNYAKKYGIDRPTDRLVTILATDGTRSDSLRFDLEIGESLNTYQDAIDFLETTPFAADALSEAYGAEAPLIIIQQ